MRRHAEVDEGAAKTSGVVKSLKLGAVQTTPAPVSIFPIKTPEHDELRDYWPFIRRGLSDIRKKIETDWVEEDVFTSLRTGGAQAYVVMRGARMLGHFTLYRQPRPFSGKVDCFLWTAWALPLRERQPDDNIPEAIAISLQFMQRIAREMGAQNIVSISSRRGVVAWGLKPKQVIYALEVS